MMQTPIENGRICTRFSPEDVHGALPKFEIIMKLLPKAFNVIEVINHIEFTDSARI